MCLCIPQQYQQRSKLGAFWGMWEEHAGGLEGSGYAPGRPKGHLGEKTFAFFMRTLSERPAREGRTGATVIVCDTCAQKMATARDGRPD